MIVKLKMTIRHHLCTICRDPNRPLTDGEFQAEDVQRTSEGFAHSSCYYGALGEEVEKYPVRSPHVHGK